MAVTYQIENYKTYGKVVAITNGTVDIKVTADVGPRVIYLALADGQNVMFNDDSREVTKGKGDPIFESAFGKDKYWQIYGGHRIWASPEEYPYSYVPGDEPVKWTAEGNKFTFEPNMFPTLGLKFTLELVIDNKKPLVTVNNIIENHSGGIRRIAVWALSVLASNGLEIVPLPKEKPELLSSGTLELWPYTNMADGRVHWGKEYITLRSVEGTPDGAFKFGITNTAGRAAYINNGTAFIKKFTHNKHGNYPDHGMSFETYTNDKFIEMETLGELSEMLPGETSVHTEQWVLKKVAKAPNPKNEAAVAKLAERLFK
ncbi:MAG TPA: hypothetical protein PK629_02995 [Oscillospiraceae bacterium]|nr:hypothetical protein [Oscillospiraceae bacterium]HPF55459.1 hypothetical protein [Clostridiales bacterium]HPK34293.1 hypothetical protein [Oscillospiraceae bacterium]HPR74804.1 hypothetical protein [Oscillospiraceae bacterium]